MKYRRSPSRHQSPRSRCRQSYQTSHLKTLSWTSWWVVSVCASFQRLVRFSEYRRKMWRKLLTRLRHSCCLSRRRWCGLFRALHNKQVPVAQQIAC